MTNHIRAHNTDADDKRREAEKAADAKPKQSNAAPSQPKNAPERVPGQNIPVEQRKGPKPEHDETDEHYRASDTVGVGDFIAPGQQHPTSNTDRSKDEDGR